MEKRLLKPNEIYTQCINAAESKVKLTTVQAVLLGILAGAFIAIGGFSSTVVSHNMNNFSISKLLAGAVFPVGLMFVIICGGELFTGNALMFAGILHKKVSLKQVLKNWVIVYFSNFVGALIIVLLLYFSGSLNANNCKLGAATIKASYAKCMIPGSKAFFSGILCNFIVCLTVWGAFAAKDIISKVAIIWFPIMAFVVSGFEHSVANMYFLFMGLIAKGNFMYAAKSMLSEASLQNINIMNIFNNLIWVTLGNIVGGAILVAAIYWGVFREN